MAVTLKRGVAPVTDAKISSVYCEQFSVTLTRVNLVNALAVYVTNPDGLTVGCTVTIKDLKEAIQAIEE